MQYLILITELILITHINSNDSPSMSGFYTDGLDKAIDKIEIVYPEKVSKDGSFVSHYLPHFYDMEAMENRPRRTSGYKRGRRDEAIHFYVPIDGQSNHLELWPNLNFISPSLVVERRDARDASNINKAKISHISSKQCHYNGRIVGKPDSSVALSTCYGLAGYIRVPDGEEYLIEPVKDSKPAPDREHPHIIYKRSALKEKNGPTNCLTKGSAKDALDERMNWESMFGDQVRQEMSGININEIMRNKIEGQKELEPIESPSAEKSRYDVVKFPIASESLGNIDVVDSKVQTKMQSSQDEPRNENQENEVRDKKLIYGNKLKLKSVLHEKNMGDIKLPDDRFQAIKPLDQSNLYDMEINENEGNIFKRDLKFEANEYSKINTDYKQNEYSDSKIGKLDYGGLSSGNIQTFDDKVSKTDSKSKGKRDVLSNIDKLSMDTENIDLLIKSDSNNNKEKIVSCGNQDTIGQSASKERGGQFNSGTNTRQEPNMYNLNNVNQHSKESVQLGTQNKNVHLGQNDETRQVNKDFNKVKLNLDKIYDKRSEQDTSNTILSDQLNGISNADNDIDTGTNENGKNKVKRNDNTIHLIIETEPEVNNAEFNNMNSRSGLFCQGNNCLEIKPVLLNTSSSNSAGFTNNTNNAESKPKSIIKRFAFEDECSAETTTEKPLLCFDLYSKLFNLELMVTVDYKVVKMHENDDIENFILTVINMVSTNFFDRSIGINFSVVLVRLILLTTCIKELDSDRFNPEELLENFCTWQVLINPGSDDHPHHHDLAILVTRMDKCEGQVMGVTYMTSVCRPDKACLVCIDEGLLLANTITHQIGHSLGAEHDDSESSGCSSHSPTGTPYHMSPVISETSSAWSSCSKDAIIQFVRTQGSWCLTDLPIEKGFKFPLMLPGQIYSAPQQCRLNFHMTSIPCSVGSFCSKLYCQVTEQLCATKGDPPADGTFCAADMWCFHKQCVHIGRRPGAINGEWGPWTEWSICTRSCGGGVANSYRICNNPKPSNGGRFCIGDRIRHRMCATKPCQGFTESFRDLQCKRTEDRAFRGMFHNWVQYHSHFVNIECALVCQNRKGDVVMRSPVVADGTPCKAGTRNVCIQGSCRNVGCDWVIDSKAKEDACGICHGNSTECRIVQGSFDEPTTQKGLVEFLRIPKDSGMIFVREIAPSANIIVVSGAINRVFYLNGVGSEDSMPGDVSFGLTHGVYEVRSLMERIFIRGPLSEDLLFYVLFKEPNKGVHYQYAVPETDPTYIPRYLWQYIDWDPCTDPCSGGSQRAHAKCVEDRGGVVDDQYCTESTRPIDIIRPCNEFPCHAKWWVSVWSDCICTGSSSVMFRSVLCMRATDESVTIAEVVKEAECVAHKKPPTQKPCNATVEDTEFFKRSVNDGSILRTRKDIRRAINPKTAYSAFMPDKEKVKGDKKETSSPNKSQRNAVKPQSVKGDDETKKLKTKLTDKGSPDTDKNKVIKDKNDEPTLTKDSKPLSYKEPQSPVKEEALPLGPGKGNQLVMLNVKNSDSSPAGSSSALKNIGKAKQADSGGSDANNEAVGQADKKCESTTLDSSCPTQELETTEPSTCKQTNPVQPHDKTICCKTTPHRRLNIKTDETTTLRPVVVKMDEVNMNNFALTVVPLDNPNKKKLPLTDPEFINLGKMGQFGVGDETNGTILSGQEAIDFLDFARGNASEEPVVLHEEMHNN